MPIGISQFKRLYLKKRVNISYISEVLPITGRGQRHSTIVAGGEWSSFFWNIILVRKNVTVLSIFRIAKELYIFVLNCL
jgi:hypothetical protein